MKKFILFLSVAAIGFITPVVSHAQLGSGKLVTTTSYGNTLDTVVNTATKTTTLADGKTKLWNVGLTAQVITKKISGTVGGTLILQGSVDGVEWNDIGSAASITDGNKNYTFNTTQRWPYYRVSWAGASTMSASIKVYLIWY